MSTVKSKPLMATLKTDFNSSTCPNGLGAIEILAKEEKIAARIYVRNRMAYAIDISNFPIEVIRRIITSEYITATNREILLGKYEKQLNSPAVVDFSVNNNMIPLVAAVSYVKDLFLGAFDYLATIELAQFQWKPNVTPSNISAPEIELDRLWKIVESRQEELKDIADDFTVGVNQVRNLTFRKTKSNVPPSNQIEANIYALATGEWSLLDFARQYGMSLLLASYEARKLWFKGGIELIYDGEFKIKPSEEKQTQYRLENSLRAASVEMTLANVPSSENKTEHTLEIAEHKMQTEEGDPLFIKIEEHLNAIESHMLKIKKLLKEANE
jgi:hypothetical protein